MLPLQVRLSTDKNQSRWIVFGFVLNEIVVKSMRPIIAKEILKEYDNLKITNSIHVQKVHSFPPTYLKSSMHYKNINDNGSKTKSTYDYEVVSYIDLSKLFLEKHMAKFDKFDETADGSVLLNLLERMPIFSTKFQAAASSVKQGRNAWAHCNFTEWSMENFDNRFEEMVKLIEKVGSLPDSNVKRTLEDLHYWKNKGDMFCISDTDDFDLLKLVRDHVNKLSTDVKNMKFETDKLRLISENIKLISWEVEERIGKLDHKHDLLQHRVAQVESSQGAISAKQEDLEQRVTILESQATAKPYGEVGQATNETTKHACHCKKSIEGGDLEIEIDGTVKMKRDVCANTVGLGELLSYQQRILQDAVINAVTTACGGERDDQIICSIRAGSLIVILHCFTDERFLEFLKDYESKQFSERLQKEFSKLGYPIQRMKLEILNKEKVNKTKRDITRRYATTLGPDRGADVNCENMNTDGPRDIDIEIKEDNGTYIERLYLACEKGDNRNVEKILQRIKVNDIEKYFDADRSPLRIACYHGHTAVVQTLLKHNIDIRKEKKLECGNSEIIRILNMNLNKSVKHKEKIEALKQMKKDQLVQDVGLPITLLSYDKSTLLGNGSMGTSVYVGVLQDEKEVAVKRVLIQAGEKLAANETEILHSIKCPHIVSNLYLLRGSQFIYLILDLCEETLKDLVKCETAEYLRDHGQRIIKEILTGLNVLHSQGIVHRDLKPTNVLVDVEGRMKLADFGISRVLKQDETSIITDVKGTFGWVPAEVIEAMHYEGECRIKKKSDIQVTGMVAFYTLTKGEHPFGKPYERMGNIRVGNPVALKKLADSDAETFVSWLISNKIDDRPFAHEALEHPFMDKVEAYNGRLRPVITLR